jgi:hypothetical protein
LTFTIPSFGASLDESHRTRLQAALIKLLEEGIPEGRMRVASAIYRLACASSGFGELDADHRARLQALIALLVDGSPNGLIGAASAIFRLTCTSPGFGASLCENDRIRVQAVLNSMLADGSDLEKIEASAAMAALSEVCSGFGGPLDHISTGDLHAALASLVTSPSGPEDRFEAVACLTPLRRVYGSSFVSSLVSSFPAVRDHLPAELLALPALTIAPPPASVIAASPATGAAVPTSPASPSPTLPPSSSPPPPAAADIALLTRMMDLASSSSSSSPAASDSLDLIPILSGLKHTLLQPLPIAVTPIEPLCPDIIRIAGACLDSARQRLAKPEMQASPYGQLTEDEAGAIMLYTEQFQPVSLFKVVNETLRDNGDPTDRTERLKPLLGYLKLLLRGLRKLPAVSAPILYRGIRPGADEDLFTTYKRRQEQKASVSWWGFTSTTRRLQVLENAMFCGGKGSRVMFTIVECKCGVDIRGLSRFAREDEVVLPPGVEFEVLDVSRGAIVADQDLVQITLRVLNDGRKRIGEVE